MKKLRCIIVDDEPLARNGLAEDIRAVDFMEVCGIADSALAAIELLARQPVDLVFLDIEMPRLTGFDMLQAIGQPPMVILTTAYAHYAPESYDMGVIDYLLKPIAFPRLLKACRKAKDYYDHKTGAATQHAASGYFFVKHNGRHEKILLSELLYIEASDNYITIHTTARKFLVYQTLKSMEASLPSDQFVKVHKSFIVAFHRIDSLDNNRLFIREHCIPVSRNFKDNLAGYVAAKKITGHR